MDEDICILSEPTQHLRALVSVFAEGAWIRLPAAARVAVGVGLVQLLTGARWVALELRQGPTGTVVVAGPAR